jgi:hypothetical protein
VSGFEIVGAVVAAGLLLTFVYALIRLPMLLRRGDVEPAGRDSDTFRRRKPSKPL